MARLSNSIPTLTKISYPSPWSQPTVQHLSNIWTLVRTSGKRIASLVLPLSIALGVSSAAMSQSPKVPILSREDVTDENRESHLKQIIEHLSQTIGERNLSKPEKLSETAGFVQDYLETNGYSIAKQEFEVSGRLCANLIAEVVKEKPREIVLIGSHYDSVEEHQEPTTTDRDRPP